MSRTGIQWISTGMIALLAIFLVYYLYRALGQLIPFAFTEPEQWAKHWIVKGVDAIPVWLRVAYFLVWCIPIAASVVMIVMSMHLSNLIRCGIFFELRTIKSLQWVGLSAALAGVGVMLGNSLWPWMVTLMNTTAKRGVTFSYESSEMGVTLLGVGVFLMGWILKCAVLMRSENEEFV